MDVKLGDVLAGETARGVEPQEDPAVEGLARLGARERGGNRLAMARSASLRTADARGETEDVARGGAGHAYHRDARAPGGGGERVYGVPGRHVARARGGARLGRGARASRSRATRRVRRGGGNRSAGREGIARGERTKPRRRRERAPPHVLTSRAPDPRVPSAARLPGGHQPEDSSRRLERIPSSRAHTRVCSGFADAPQPPPLFLRDARQSRRRHRPRAARDPRQVSIPSTPSQSSHATLRRRSRTARRSRRANTTRRLSAARPIRPSPPGAPGILTHARSRQDG